MTKTMAALAVAILGISLANAMTQQPVTALYTPAVAGDPPNCKACHD